MKGPSMTDQELLEEISFLKKRIKELERSESDHKKAERALRKAEEKYRSIFENATEGIFQTTREGRFLSANPALAKMFGYDSREDLMSSVTSVGSQLYADPERRLEHLRILSEKGTVENFEGVAYRKDGSIIWVSMNTRVVRDRTGTPVLYEGFVVDITARKLAEGALRESEGHLNTILSNVGAYIYLKDTQYRYTYANNKVCDLFGFKENEIVGKGDASFFSPASVEEIMRSDRRVIERGETIIREETDLTSSDNLPRTYWVVKLPLKDGLGNICGLCGISTDITDLKRAEKALHESEQRYRAVFENTGAATVIIEKDTTISLCNAEFERLSGYKRNEIEGKKSWTEFVSREDLDRMLVQHRMRREDHDQALQRYEFRFIPRAGGIRNTYLTIDTIPGTEKSVASLTDITDRKRMEEDLARAQKLESLGTLAGGIAHDFNNLMTAILGYVDLAMMGLPAHHASYPLLKAALRSAEQTKDLTGRLITFSEGGFPVKQVSDISEVLREVVRKMAKETGVQAVFDIGEDLWPVQVDEAQIRQVFYNLTMNALEAMQGGGGTLTVKAHNEEVGYSGSLPLKEGPYLRIIFADNGVGIARENLSRIFDPYFTTKCMGSNKGTGLGLSVCYSVLKKHDGHIAVASRPGKGAAFSVYLPALAGKAEEVARPPAASRYRVLIMEDEANVRKLERTFLERLGYEVTEANEGQEVIDLYREALISKSPFDLVILDLAVREGMDGKLAMERLLKEDPFVRAIIASGYENDPMIERYKDYGFRGALKKPFRFQEFAEMVKTVIDREAW